MSNAAAPQVNPGAPPAEIRCMRGSTSPNLIPGKTTANSSPPVRNTVSEPRSRSPKASTNEVRVRSPSACPCESLIRFNPSRSTATTANSEPRTLGDGRSPGEHQIEGPAVADPGERVEEGRLFQLGE